MKIPDGTGPRVRKLMEEAMAPSTEEELKGMGSDLRAVAHLILRAARRVEEGDLKVIGELLNERRVQDFAAKAVAVPLLSEAMLSRAERADAGDN